MAWAIPIIEGMEYVTNAAAFYQFILEEAIQSELMACFICSKVKGNFHNWKVLDQLENHTIPHLEAFNSTWAFLAFWCQPPFEQFAKASRLACKVYRGLI